MASFTEAISSSSLTTEEKFAIFDSLPAAEISDLCTGLWKGGAFPEARGSEDKLVQSGWYGKRFGGENDVDPLVFNVQDGDGKRFVASPPKVMALAGQGVAPPARQAEIETSEPSARLREVQYRGVVTASMVYNELPIIDHFRKADENTLLGVMDNIKLPGPAYFFVLRR